MYSLDENGKCILWNMKNSGFMTKALVSQSQLDISASCQRKDFNLSRLTFFKHNDPDHLYVTNGQEIVITNKFLAANRSLQIQSTPNCMACVSNLYLSKADVIIAGYDDGVVRLFMKTHKDPLMSLEGFTKDKIVQIFPANYVKLDKDTNEQNMLECIGMLNILDSNGKLHIFDFETNQNEPEQTIDLITDRSDNVNVLEAKYNMKSSILTAAYMNGGIMTHLSFNMRQHKKKIPKLTLLKQINDRIVNLLKISFVNI